MMETFAWIGVVIMAATALMDVWYILRVNRQITDLRLRIRDFSYALSATTELAANNRGELEKINARSH